MVPILKILNGSRSSISCTGTRDPEKSQLMLPAAECRKSQLILWLNPWKHHQEPYKSLAPSTAAQSRSDKAPPPPSGSAAPRLRNTSLRCHSQWHMSEGASQCPCQSPSTQPCMQTCTTLPQIASLPITRVSPQRGHLSIEMHDEYPHVPADLLDPFQPTADFCHWPRLHTARQLWFKPRFHLFMPTPKSQQISTLQHV